MSDLSEIKSTGPRTPEGKNVSSKNATTHGLCSHIVILPGESEAEWQAHLALWHYEYEYPKDIIIALSEQAALAQWFLNRATRRYHEAEQALYLEQPDSLLWTDEQHKRLERFLRYRTTHERSFYRAFNILKKTEAEYLKSCADLHRAQLEERRLRKEYQRLRREKKQLLEKKQQLLDRASGKEPDCESPNSESDDDHASETLHPLRR